MIELYCSLIRNKRRTFDQVPANLQADVEARLKELGYDINGEEV